jgi:hypothetical protein
VELISSAASTGASEVCVPEDIQGCTSPETTDIIVGLVEGHTVLPVVSLKQERMY